MLTISLCMIVRNAQCTIERCLDSVQHIVDEINIIDTGSTDRTKDIVQNYTSRIYDFIWCDHFAKARNFSFQQATKDYILWLDADDVMTKENQYKFIQLKHSLYPTVDAITMDHYLTLDDDGIVECSERKCRLVKRASHFQWEGAVHEYLRGPGQLYHSDIAVTHVPLTKDVHRTIRIYEGLIQGGHSLTARDRFHYANELKLHQRYLEAINQYNLFLDSDLGITDDRIEACLHVGECYRHLQDDKQAQQAILQSFLYDRPKPEACCRMGQFFMEQSKHKEAIYWYSQALQQAPANTMSIQKRAYSTWIPHLQLSLLYRELRLFENAYQHNVEAGKWKPNHPEIINNDKYLVNQLKN
ncbi:glycosyltransferase family 2 protein [Lysinibacillus cavernae]|uniref:glycosyltransferase family 2 protein n=1 Tax=Lysinibacillus cavernae TaxID=2666135 RepID=UPI0012D87168|nr:glycosyltransferase [Lysinibacillus cavernae]